MRLVALLALVGCGAPDTTLSIPGKDGEMATGSGKLEIDKSEITIDAIQGTYSKSEAFTVTSIGDANLLIYEIRLVANPDEVFFFDEVDDVEHANGQAASYSVVARYDTEPGFAADGELRLRTNDPDNAQLIVPLHAYPEGYVPPEDTGGGTGGDTGGGTGTP
jgi:hypothetical protein